MDNEKNKANSADLSGLRIDREVSEEGRSRRSLVLAGSSALLILVVVLLFVFVGSSSAPLIDVATVSMVYPSQSETILTASGYVVAQRQAAVASKGTGRLEYLGVEEGDSVKTGAIIARLEHDDVDAALEQMRAALRMAEALLQQRQADFREAELSQKRQKELFERGLIANSEYDLAEARYKSAEAAVQSARAQIEQASAAVSAAEVNVENTNIRAPFDGTVLTKNADIGEMVAPFAASSNSRGAVVTIADMTSLEVEADVSESNIQRVVSGQRCEIILDAFPGSPYPAFVHKIVPTADRAKATVLTKIRFNELDEKVLPEMSAKVNFLSAATNGDGEDQKPFLAVPASAVVERDAGAVVFVVRTDALVETPVTLGRKLDGRIEVIAGVSGGTTIALSPEPHFESGTAVKLRSE